MTPDAVPQLYDAAYAAAYDDRFVANPAYRHIADHERAVLERLLPLGGPWLDVACGTGHFLGQFPEADRAGLDLSPAMAATARARNPTARFVEEGSFLEPRPAWADRWGLVSCMWCAYTYVETVAEVDRLLANLASWTAPDGLLYLPLCHIGGITQVDTVPHRFEDLPTFGGACSVDAVVWSYEEPDGERVHRHLVSPHVDHLVGRLREAFSRVDLVYYPPYGTGPASAAPQRRALLAAGKGGPVPPATTAVLDALQAESRARREAVLAQDAALAAPAGGLLRVWRSLPDPLRRAVRRALGYPSAR